MGRGWPVAAVAMIALTAGAARGSAPRLPVTVHDHTGIRLTGVIWTGSGLLYVENTTNTIWAPGTPPTQFASMPRVVEETRCVVPPGRHGWPGDGLFCHSPDNVIYRVASDGGVSVFARLGAAATSDGALAFDTFGTFGYRLVAATGRSGSRSHGGSVYAVDAAGAVSRLGRYASPRNGGADELVQAPAGLGGLAGEMVLTVDAESHGALLAFGASGRSRVLAFLPDGPNPIAAVPARLGTAPTPVPRGLYLSDTISTNVYRVPATALRRYAGDLVVGTELRGLFYVVMRDGRRVVTRRIPLHLPGRKLNLESAAFVN